MVRCWIRNLRKADGHSSRRQTHAFEHHFCARLLANSQRGRRCCQVLEANQRLFNEERDKAGTLG